MAYFATGAAFTAALNKLPAATTGSYKAFDAFYYAQNYMGAYAGTLSPIEHFVQVGAARGYAPNSDFDPAYYQSKYADLKDLDAADLLYHYVASGLNEGRAGNATLAAVTWSEYLAAYPDVAKYVTDNLASFGGSTTNGAIAHYVKFGVAQGFTLPAKAVVQTAGAFALTIGTDSGATFTGATGNDSFTATGATLTVNDTLVGGAGTDTLTITDLTGALAAGVPTGVSVTGIESAVVTTSGSIGAIPTPAVSTAVAQVNELKYSATSASGITLTIGGAEYKSGALTADTTGANAAAAAVTLINAAIGGTQAAAGGTNTATVTVTAAVAGKSLPSISGSTITTAVKPVQNSPVAVKEVATFSITNTATNVMTVYIDGVKYTAASGANATEAGAGLAAIINAALGAGVAVNASGVVTVTAPVAGVGLPIITAAIANMAAVVTNLAVPNSKAFTSASTAYSVSGWTDLTSFDGTATTAANVTGAKTTDLKLTGTAVIATGGKDVTVTASDSVFVSGAAGAVTVKGGTSSTTLVGAVASDTGSTSGDAAGIYVTGGTTVTITGTKDSGEVKVGAAPYAKAGVNSTGFPQTNGNSSKTPTGDVSITNVTKTTSTSTGAVTGTYSTGAATVYTNGGTTVTINGAGTTTVTDANTLALSSATGVAAVAGTSKLATVNLAGLSGNATIKSDAISTISVSDTLSARTVTVSNSGTTGVNAGAINLKVSNVGTGDSTRLTLDNATATSVGVSSGAASAYNTVGSTATNSSSKSWVTLTTPKATTITMTNDKSVDLGDLSAAGLAKLASVDGSGATGSIAATVGATSEQGLSFTGGSGKDSVTIKSGASLSANATTAKITAINLGAGDDSLLNGSTATHTVVGATFNGGDGSDTLAASLLTVGNGTQFTNFEVLGLDLTSGTMDTTLMSSAASLSLLAQGGTYTNVAASQGLTIAADKTAGTNTLTFASAVTVSTAKSDSYTVTFAHSDSTTLATATANEVDGGVVVIEGIETVNIVSGGSGNISNAINLSDASATKLVITGDKDLDLDFGATDNDDTNSTTHFFGTSSATSTDGLGVTEIDASAMTGKLNINTTDVALSTSARLLVKTGSGNDTITLASKSTVDSGAGDDTITTVAGQSSTLTGGAGKDNFIVSATIASSITAPVFTSITDFTSGDTITMGTAVNAVSLKSVGVANVATATSLVDAITKALGGGATGITAIANNTAVQFNYGSDTYIVVNDTNAGFDTNDIIVKLTGNVELAWTTTTGLVGLA